MLESVGHPTAVNPDRALRKMATERGWPIVAFSLAVPLRQRLRPAAPAITAATIGTAAAGAAIGILAFRRRRQRRFRA
jgi:hypothetical protein